jgi:hypothetical protein
MRSIHAALFALLSACSVSVVRTPPPAATTDEERVVQAQVDAFNRRDIDRYVATLAPDVVFYEFPADTVFNGAARIRQHYTELFAGPDARRLHVDVGERIVKEPFVTQQESYHGFPGEDTHVSVVIYEVRGGRIQNMWFMN